MARARVLHWNGKDVPEELRDLPAGTYVLEPVDQVPALSAAEEQGLLEALGDLHAGKGVSHEHVRTNIDSILKK